MYTYKLRPVYGGDDLLLEFVKGPEEDHFLTDLFNLFSPLDFKTTAVSDLWMNDEVLFHITSIIGEFTLSKDTWGFAFIMADKNQEGIKKLNEYLLQSEKFEALSVDFSQYKKN